jgi:protein-S-isoprenylcysteine O-methyltransferase Ste14
MTRRTDQYLNVAKTALWMLVAPGTVGFLLPTLLVRLGLIRGQPYAEPDALSLALVVTGLILISSAAKGFAVEGRGTPAPFDPPRKLVIRGAYRYVRNPMYVAMGLIILGFVRWYHAPGLLVYFAAVMLAFHLFVVLYEEPMLQRVFGERYDEYRQNVGRWVPKVW